MRSGFFNSEIIGYDAESMPVFDRAEEASFFAKYFSQFISNGVFPNPSTNMQVLATTDMQIKVDIGVCYINGYMGWVEQAETFEIEESDVQARIDRIVARLDFADRSIKLFVKKGTAQGNPAAPALQRDYNIYEIALADVRVNANAIEITQANITDLRLNTELCGVVANQLQHVDTTTLFNQYQDWLNRITNDAETALALKKQEFNTELNDLKSEFTDNFNTWFKNVQIILSGDVAGNLLVKINNNEERIKVLETQSAKHIYGVRRNVENTTPEWERIEDSVGLIANATHDGSAVQNDFDSIYPWSDIISYNYDMQAKRITAYCGEPQFEFDGSNGEVFTRIPEFWYKREVKTEEDGNTYEYFYVANYKADGFIKSEQFSISRYLISKDTEEIHSKSNAAIYTDYTITNARTKVKSLGSEFSLLDWHYFLIQLLYLVEYANSDSQTVLGKGITDVTGEGYPKTFKNSGECNQLEMKSGCLGNDGVHNVIYRGIEDIYGNQNNCFLDGIKVNGYQDVYICYNSEKYCDEGYNTKYRLLGYLLPSGKNQKIQKNGFDENNPLISLPLVLAGSGNSAYGKERFCIEEHAENGYVCIGGACHYGFTTGLWSIALLDKTKTASIRIIKSN